MSANFLEKEVLRQISYLVVAKILTWSWCLDLGSEATWLRTKKTFSKNCKNKKQKNKTKQKNKKSCEYENCSSNSSNQV